MLQITKLQQYMMIQKTCFGFKKMGPPCKILKFRLWGTLTDDVFHGISTPVRTHLLIIKV